MSLPGRIGHQSRGIRNRRTHRSVLKLPATPEEIAELILYLCSDKAAFITGQPIRIDGGLGLSIGGSKRAAE